MPAEFAGMINATVRGRDKGYGSGEWHASRDNGKRRHEGVDLVVAPGQAIIAPVLVKVVRRADPYKDTKDAILSGVVLQVVDRPVMTIKLLYVEPMADLIGRLCTKGSVIGHAQSLQHLYPGITDHVHVEIWLGGERVDPTPYLIHAGEPAPGGSAVTA